MPAPDYLQNSIEAMSLIEPTHLGRRELGNFLGHGTSARVFSLGILTGAEQLGPIALKIRTEGHDPLTRLRTEMSTAYAIRKWTPELSTVLPGFMGLLALGSKDNYIGMLTEDASYGGSIPVEPMPASEEAVTMLREGFRAHEAAGMVQPQDLRKSVAFSVGGEERWLDLTPSPIMAWPAAGTPLRSEFDNVRSALYAAKEDLTCVIGSDSVLARSIARS